MKFSSSMHSIWFEYHWYHSISSLSILHKCFHMKQSRIAVLTVVSFSLNWFQMLSSSISMSNGTFIICTTFYSAKINRHTFRFNKTVLSSNCHTDFDRIQLVYVSISSLFPFKWHTFFISIFLFSNLLTFSIICILMCARSICSIAFIFIFARAQAHLPDTVWRSNIKKIAYLFTKWS